MFFEGSDEKELSLKIKEFEQAIYNHTFDPEIIEDTVAKFSKQRFQNEIRSFIEEKWAEHRKNNA